MTGKLSKNFHGVGIGPLSKILAVNGFENRWEQEGSPVPAPLNIIGSKLSNVKKLKFLFRSSFLRSYLQFKPKEFSLAFCFVKFRAQVTFMKVIYT